MAAEATFRIFFFFLEQMEEKELQKEKGEKEGNKE